MRAKGVSGATGYLRSNRMTRKCVLCKGTNYKNTYSFFSAPKDPETRKKWQAAIGIENYAVTDDTYVCSKHFHKEDIITHWVSGVPPHVITIKYKKCRLRPGAVPGRNIKVEESIHTTNEERSNDSDINMSEYLMFKEGKAEQERVERESFIIPRMKQSTRKDQEKSYKTLNYKFPHALEGYSHNQKEKLNRLQAVKDTSNANFASSQESEESKDSQYSERVTKRSSTREEIRVKEERVSGTDLTETLNSDRIREQARTPGKENSYRGSSEKTRSPPREFNASEGEDTSMETWEHKVVESNSHRIRYKEKAFKPEEDVYRESEEMFGRSEYESVDGRHRYPGQNDETEGSNVEMLFEDLLEICTEVILPRGWSCLVTSKGHATTVVYLYMGMTKSGMPFAEKQVFIRSNMILRCAAVNREINPLMHNLIREGKHLKVENLLDVEELIDEFDQRVVCQGLYNNTIDGFQEIGGIKMAYKDGVRWRHVLCPLLLNNDSTRCTRCITLSHMLTRKSSTNLLPAFHYNPVIYVKNQQNLHHTLLRQIRKRTRKHDRRYEYIKVLKE